MRPRATRWQEGTAGSSEGRSLPGVSTADGVSGRVESGEERERERILRIELLANDSEDSTADARQSITATCLVYSNPFTAAV